MGQIGICVAGILAAERLTASREGDSCSERSEAIDRGHHAVSSVNSSQAALSSACAGKSAFCPPLSRLHTFGSSPSRFDAHGAALPGLDAIGLPGARDDSDTPCQTTGDGQHSADATRSEQSTRPVALARGSSLWSTLDLIAFTGRKL